MYNEFSQRIKLESPKKIQIHSIDNELQNGIWNIYYHYFEPPIQSFENTYKLEKIRLLHNIIQESFYGKLVDELTGNLYEDYKYFKRLFYSLPWNKTYDFVQFIIRHIPDNFINIENLIFELNCCFERNASAYRFVGTYIVEITDKNQKDIIEKSLMDMTENGFSKNRIYLDKALEYLSHKDKLDLNNSITESISAVESICKTIANDNKLDLNGSLSIVKNKLNVHDGIIKSISSLYRFASDTTRHGKIERPEIEIEDAVYMIVSCSAFISYIISKSQKAGIDLSK